MVLTLADFQAKYGRRGVGAIIRSLLATTQPIPGKMQAHTDALIDLAGVIADLEQLMSDDSHTPDPNPCVDSTLLNPR